MSDTKPPSLEGELVRAFVIAGHRDLDEIKRMLEAEPGLVNATWDWGAGDWETALGGASHVGRPDIAAYLLTHGARMDVFCAAMMGKIELVKAFLEDNPDIVHLKGPHGIPLIHHAKLGKQDAVVELLKARGATA